MAKPQITLQNNYLVQDVKNEAYQAYSSSKKLMDKNIQDLTIMKHIGLPTRLNTNGANHLTGGLN
ncbi:hypothetical protein FRX31_034202 [Thalictrum thalictroides]|uniref:Uncharacterized protein n=1 Tax=Thalictrum thalictroides TaxID=46969 RepID=A0A7J6UUU1_THATH|nr:hypothetical protein FRX31_034202 [Thalictrum thalictroides]